ATMRPAEYFHSLVSHMERYLDVRIDKPQELVTVRSKWPKYIFDDRICEKAFSRLRFLYQAVIYLVLLLQIHMLFLRLQALLIHIDLTQHPLGFIFRRKKFIRFRYGFRFPWLFRD